jgi:heme-degrading monooxygenase HmoA
MVTEVLTFQLNENSSLADSSSPAATTIREFLKVELAADGAKQAHFGHFIEKPDTVVIFVGWDSLEAHQKFIKTG